MKTALIIFVRNPVLGKVKTRLAASIGMDAALRIYQKLLSHTFCITDPLPVHKFIFYTGGLIENDMWSRDGFYKFKQTEGDLGNRMQQAFENVFTIGYERVVIIGSDCYDLTSVIINNAFDILNQNDLVLGPAHDGGYYLLGMKSSHPPLFQNKPWSTSFLFQETVRAIEALQLSYGLLPLLNDMDDVKDVPANWLNE